MSNKRSIAGVLGGFAAIALFLLVNPWIVLEPNTTVNQAVTIIFWVSFLALLVVLFEMRKEPGGETIEDLGPGLHPIPVQQFPSRSVLAAHPPLRRLHLARGRLSQVQRQGLDGRRCRPEGYWERAVVVPDTGSPAITFDWYRAFIQTLLDNNAHTWFAPLITFGEMAGAYRAHRRTPDRVRSVLRGAHEHVVPAGRFGLVEPGPVHPRDRPDAGLEGRGLLRPGSLRPAIARHAVASRTHPHRRRLDANANADGTDSTNLTRYRGVAARTPRAREGTGAFRLQVVERTARRAAGSGPRRAGSADPIRTSFVEESTGDPGARELDRMVRSGHARRG